MPFATTAAIVGGLSAAGAIGGAALSSGAAGHAASTQAQAAEDAAQLQYQNSQDALNFQKQVWNQQQSNIAPWLQSGGTALSTMDQLMGLNAPSFPANYGQPISGGSTVPGSTLLNPGQSTAGTPQPKPGGPAMPTGQPRSELMPMNGTLAGMQAQGGPAGAIQPFGGVTQPGAPTSPSQSGGAPVGGPQPGMSTGQLVPFAPWNQTFQAPTNVTEQNDPGYQFRFNQGVQALQNSAAARGTLLTGDTARALTEYGQDYASNEYNNVYNRAFGQYQQSYNIFENNQTNQWNRLASLAGLGQTAAGQLNSAGSTTAGNVGNILLGSAGQIGQQMNNSAAATASGYVGGANAWSGAINNIGDLAQLYSMQSLLNPGAIPAASSAPNYNDPAITY